MASVQKSVSDKEGLLNSSYLDWIQGWHKRSRESQKNCDFAQHKPCSKALAL